MFIKLEAQERAILGKKTKRLRAKGLIPAEVFGHGFLNKHVSVQEKAFTKAYREAGENTVLELLIGGEKIPVLISHVAKNNLSGTVLAVDFYRVKKGEKIRTHVPVEYVGTDMAAKSGYVLVKVTSQLEVEGLPEHIPHSFKIDVSNLTKPGQNIEVKDIEAPESVKFFAPPETVLVTVGEQEKEEAAPVPAAEEGDKEEKGEKKEGEEKEEREEKK